MLHRRKNSFNKYAHRTFKSNKKKQENKKTHQVALIIYSKRLCGARFMKILRQRAEINKVCVHADLLLPHNITWKRPSTFQFEM